MVLQTLESSNVKGILKAIEDDGACIANNVLSRALCDELMGDFQSHLDEMPWGTDELGYRDNFYGEQTKRLHGLFSKSPRMAEVLMHPLFVSLSHQLFVESGMSREVRLSNCELMVLNQDQGAQAFHTDGASWYRVQQREENEILISANCALTEFTVTNGATRVVPGSHRWSKMREPEPDEICHAVMPKGSALIYSGNAVHSGGANRENSARFGLYLGYIASWLRPLENQLITNTPEDIMALPEEARKMLDVSPGGFTVFA